MINGYVRLWIVSQVIFGVQKRRRHSIKTDTTNLFNYGDDSSMNRLFTKAVFLWSNINIRI